MNWRVIMTNSIRILLTSIALLVLSTVGPEMAQAKGKPIKVNLAVPDNAMPGERKGIVLKGADFPVFPASAQVTFIYSPDQTHGEVTVVGGPVVTTVSDTLEFEIDVEESADLGEYDIKVEEISKEGTFTGRKGKGTTLFKVQQAGAEFTPVDIEVGYLYDDGTNPSYEMEEASPYKGPYPNDSEQNHPFGEGWNIWDDNTITAAEMPRPCRIDNNVINSTSEGRYDCFEDASNGGVDDPNGGRVTIDLVGAGMQWVDVTPGRKKKNPGFCMLLKDWANFTPVGAAVPQAGDPLSFGVTRYQVYFVDGCVEGDCPMSIGTVSYSGYQASTGLLQQLHPFINLTNLNLDNGRITELADVGRLVVRGMINPNGSDIEFDSLAENEVNVFTEPQELPIEQFRISFEAEKNGALLATCETTGAVNNIFFVTDPQ